MKTRNRFFLTTVFAAFFIKGMAQVVTNDSISMDSLNLINLPEITIEEKRPLFSVEGEKTLYNVSEDPTVQAGTASDALQNAPGVHVDVEGNVTLRGASSVEIWINDSPSHLTKETLKTYLQTMPANAIDRIEVVSNPSARYATQADAVINIVLNAKVKRNEFVSFGLNAASVPYLMPWASYVWANEKWTFNAYASTYWNKSETRSVYDRTLYADDGSLSSRTQNTQLMASKDFGPFAYLDAACNIDSMNVFRVSANLNTGFSSTLNESHRKRNEYIYQPGFYEYDLRFQSDDNNYLAGFGSLYYLHKFDNNGHNVSAMVDGQLSSMGFTLFGDKDMVLPAVSHRRTRNFYDRGMPYISAQVNYNRPYSENGTLSFGILSHFDKDDHEFTWDTLSDGVYYPDYRHFYHDVSHGASQSAYLSLQHSFGKFTVQPGLRFTWNHVRVELPESPDGDLIRDYCNWLPSLHLSYRTQSMHNFKLSYTRRVSTPTGKQLTPHNLYDEENFSSGNPFLEPIFTHSLEANWTKYWDDFGSVGVSGYYKGKSNEINSINTSAYDGLYGTFVSYNHPVNVGRSYNAGGEVNVTYRPNAMFNLRLYGNLYDSYLETQYGDMQEKTISELWSYSLTLNLWTKLWNRLEVHCAARYASPVQFLFGQLDPSYAIDCGMRADFFDRRLSVFVNGNDIFHWVGYGRHEDNPSLSYQTESTYRSNFISAGFTLRFGKMELENEARQGSESAGQ